MHRFEDDEETPPKRWLLPTASNHPRVKVARVHHSTIVTVVCVIVIGGLAAHQDWPYQVTLGALGVATGLWAWKSRGQP